MELMNITRSVSELYDDDDVPHLPLGLLQQIVSSSFVVENAVISILTEVPLVSKTTFHEFFAIPAPNITQGTIPDFAPRSVMVDFLRKEYVNNPPLHLLNDTLAITTRPLTVRHKIHNATDCAD